MRERKAPCDSSCGGDGKGGLACGDRTGAIEEKRDAERGGRHTGREGEKEKGGGGQRE